MNDGGEIQTSATLKLAACFGTMSADVCEVLKTRTCQGGRSFHLFAVLRPTLRFSPICEMQFLERKRTFKKSPLGH